MLAESAPLQANTADLPCGPAWPAWVLGAGWVAIAWYCVVTVVCWIGYIQLQRYYSKIPEKAVVTTLPHSQIPHVTIIRPLKGLEPFLYDCLAASIRQDYPRDKLTIHFCLSSTQDPAYPVVKKILQDFPDADARVFIEPAYEDDEVGPNPKIRNMSQAYREAKGDIIWILDCNLWLGKGVCGRMVDRLCGFDPRKHGGRKYKFVHNLPLVVDVPGVGDADKASELPFRSYGATEAFPTSQNKGEPKTNSVLSYGGGRLEELFLSSAHAKMYSAINTVLVAPCIIGKSAMFRRSHLNYLTSQPSSSQKSKRRPGIDYFSDNICEDHLIGDRLWKGKVYEEAVLNEKWGKHSLVFGDLVIQPMSGMSVKSYFDRRVRWLRVRKFTVLLATFVEPGTESFLCSAYLAFGLTVSVPKLYPEYCSCLATWKAFFAIWILSVLIWMVIDWTVYLKLHSGVTIEVDELTPSFARPLPKFSWARRPFRDWLWAWLGREALALPIWLWSFYGGTTVIWRDKVFKVGLDMVAYEVGQRTKQAKDIKTRPPPIGRQVYQNDNDSGSDVRRRTPNGSFVSTTTIATARGVEAGLARI